MKKQLLALGICLALFQVARPAQAQTLASAQGAQAATTETQVEEKQPAEVKKGNDILSLSAHKAASESGYAKGDILVNAGLTLGTFGWGYVGGNSGGFLPVSANLEYSVSDLISVGPYVGFYSNTYYRVLGLGARGTIHATGLLNSAFDGNMNAEKLDLYGTLSLGYENAKIKSDYTYYDWSASGARFGISLGVRYMFAPKVGAFAEVGSGAFGYSTLGISFKL